MENIGERFYSEFINSNNQEKIPELLKIEEERDKGDEGLRKKFIKHKKMYNFSKKETKRYIKTNRMLLKSLFNAIKDGIFQNVENYKIVEMSFGYLSEKEREFLKVQEMSKEEINKLNSVLFKNRWGAKQRVPHIRTQQLLSFGEKPLKEVELKKLASFTPLYFYFGKDKDNSSWIKKIDKKNTKGKIFLFDEELAKFKKPFENNTIIREMFLSSYLTWKEAFEATDEWENLGYVPIENISNVYYFKPSINKVGIETKVIKGPNVAQWFLCGGSFKKEILKQIKKIESTLSKIGIDHGHPHYGNYVLLFERDKNGEVDISRFPRVYLVDFDWVIKVI